jgi:hypothetical protein
MQPHNAYALAIAFVGMCFAIAYGTAMTPPSRDPRVTCIDQRGEWVPGWTNLSGTCRFQPTAQR